MHQLPAGASSQRRRVPGPSPALLALIQRLSPPPRTVRGSGTCIPFCGVLVHQGGPDAPPELVDAVAEVLVGTDGLAGADGMQPTPPAAPLLVEVRPGAPSSPPEGFRLDVEDRDGSAYAVLEADVAGARYGARALVGLVRAATAAGGPPQVPSVHLVDWPTLGHRGVVEGFYGPPWSHQDRLDHLHFSAEHRLNSYVYAPKDDPYHRALWREPYPADRLAMLAELAAEAVRHGVRFVYALAPGLTMRLDDGGEQETLHRKAAQLWEAGIRHFALLFDDLPAEVAPDGRRLERPTAELGALHGAVCRALVDGFLRPRGVREPLLMVPTDYAGTGPSDYRTGLQRTLPDDALVWWTGSDVVVGSVSEAEAEEAATSLGRQLLLWDNFPVNDFDPARVFLGPLTGRPAHPSGPLVGIHSNPMESALASRLALATAAEYAWDPAGYDAAAAADRALVQVADDDADALRPLVRACSQWPPSSIADEELRAAAAAMLGPDGDAATAAALTWSRRFAALAQVPVAGGPLVRQLAPWSRAGAAMADAAEAAAQLVQARWDQQLSGDRRALEVAARGALDRAERPYANVLRGLVPPLLRALLPADGDDVADPELPWALLVTGGPPTAGEESMVALLRQLGLCVRRTMAATPNKPGLVVVLPGATPAAAAAAGQLPAPLLALGHPLPTGLARRTGVLHREECLRVVAPGHGLAGHFESLVQIHRGPGMVRWSEPASDATIVAVAQEEARPVAIYYPAGARLADGTTAPAARATSFLGPEGLAPWLVAPDGTRLVRTAVEMLLSGAGRR